MPTNFMITGERGIGKSSLLMYLTFLARGLIPVGGQTLRFLVIDTDIDKNTSQLGLIKKIELGLRNELSESETARGFLSDAWSFLQRIEAGGVKIKPDESETLDEVVLEEFSYSLAKTAKRLCEDPDNSPLFGAHYDGILILIDEADNASDQLDIGTFTKLLLERLQRRGCSRLMLGLAGLSDLRGRLVSSHPSSLRLFEELPLGRLSDSEVQSVVTLCLEQANTNNPQPVTIITEDARYRLAVFAEGYPHFIQQFGSSAFATDTDNVIDFNDVRNVELSGPRGALELRLGIAITEMTFTTRSKKAELSAGS